MLHRAGHVGNFLPTFAASQALAEGRDMNRDRHSAVTSQLRLLCQILFAALTVSCSRFDCPAVAPKKVCTEPVCVCGFASACARASVAVGPRETVLPQCDARRPHSDQNQIVITQPSFPKDGVFG